MLSTQTESPAAEVEVPRPNVAATVILVGGLVVTWFVAWGDLPSELARVTAIGVGISLVLSLFMELRQGRWDNLLRADLVAMVALYYLLFVEFLFPQPQFDEMVSLSAAIKPAITVCLAAFAAIAVGRHFVSRRISHWEIVKAKLPPSSLLILFWCSFGLGFFNMLLAVDFNPVEMVRYFLAPRFAVPWGRGQFGDLNALLWELGAVLYLVPPLAGIILGRRQSYSGLTLLLVLLALSFTFFYGFCTGTRNLIGSYLITFIVAYFYATRSWRATIVPGLLVVVIMALATLHAPRFRGEGLADYLSEEEEAFGPVEEENFFVDYNFYVVAAITHLFPRNHEYLGWEVPLWLVVRPVPRAFWPGKPDGESVSPQSYLGVTGGTTISATFIGEAYMSAGLLGVIIAGLGLGYFCQWWTQKAFSPHSNFGIVIYGSGFFAVAITMRSMYMLTVALLPTLAVAVAGWWLMRRQMGGETGERLRVTDKQPLLHER